MSSTLDAGAVQMTPPLAETKVKKFQIDWRLYRSVIVLGVVMVALAILTDGTFLTPRNLTNLCRQVSINGILAVGMTFVILIGGIDLSVGSVVALSGVIAGVLQVNYGLAHWEGNQLWLGAGISVAAAILTGLFCGIFNGFLITRYRIAPFIITLGMMVIARGLALIFAKGAAIAPLSESFNFIGQNYIAPLPSALLIGGVGGLALVLKLMKKGKGIGDYAGMAMIVAVTAGTMWAFESYRGLPIPVLILGALAMAGMIILQRTRLGRFVMAIGGNAEAAWLAGVPIRKITFGIYAALGALAGLSGAILSARLNGALPTAGELFELDAIAAVVIGGTSLLGGVGTVRGSIIGAFFIGTLNNGMSLLDVTEFYQKVIKGVIIILAVWIDTRQSKAGKV